MVGWFNWTMVSKFFTLGNDWKITMSIRLKKRKGLFGAPEVQERWFRCLFLHFFVRWRVHGFLTPCVKKGMYNINIPGNFAPWGGPSIDYQQLQGIIRTHLWSFWILFTGKNLTGTFISKIFGKITCHDIYVMASGSTYITNVITYMYISILIERLHISLGTHHLSKPQRSLKDHLWFLDFL